MIKYDYIEQLFEQITERISKLELHELAEIPEHQWIK
jgi:hypothetical protein